MPHLLNPHSGVEYYQPNEDTTEAPPPPPDISQEGVVSKSSKKRRTQQNNAAVTKMAAEARKLNVTKLYVADGGPKCDDHISTGIGFFDHMLDQFNSHAQVHLCIQLEGDIQDRNRHAEFNQAAVVTQVAEVLGCEFRSLLDKAGEEGKKAAATASSVETKDSSSEAGTAVQLPSETVALVSRFSCPLDEALVECKMIEPTSTRSNPGIFNCSLAPYGIYPRSGRATVGTWQTFTVEIFFDTLAKSMGLLTSLNKVRGKNAHHIVESAFKAFSRAFRVMLDRKRGLADEIMWGPESESHKQSIALLRKGSHDRSTKETSIKVDLNLDGAGELEVNTGIDTLNMIIEEIMSESKISAKIFCDGDTWVDDHHTSEDCGIAIGQVLNKALGSKGGLNRMSSATVREGQAEVQVVMDLSNRPAFFHNLDLCSSLTEDDKLSAMSIEMIDHFFDSLVINSHMTVHFVQIRPGDGRELTLAASRAFGEALKNCIAVDPRRAGATASSKGTLSA